MIASRIPPLLALSEPIPVTVIGGYLGAGKTTLVNHLLREAAGRRLAVLVNDFGELPIDADLVESRQGDTIAIAGGCVCCSFGSDLVGALMQLSGRAPRPDHVLVEASGVALPGAVGAAVTLLGAYALDGIVVLADATNVRAQAADRYLADTIARQLDDADLVVLSKTDLLPPAGLARLRAWLPARAPVVEAVRGALPFEVVLGIHQPHAGALARSAPRHPAYERLAFECLPALDAARLATALADPAMGVLRAKGVLRGAAGETVALHVVGRRAEVLPSASGAAGRLVCIGLAGRLDADAVRRAIQEPFTGTHP